MQVAFCCCFRHGLAGIYRDLSRDVPDLENKLSARKLLADFPIPIPFEQTFKQTERNSGGN